MIELINLKKTNVYEKQIKELYNSAFPSNERVPYHILKYKTKYRFANMYAIVDDLEFIGLIYLVSYQNLVFIFYFAIDPKLQSHGYGSKVLDIIKKRFSDKILLLNIEEVDDFDLDSDARRRKEFYIKNGFIPMDFKTIEYGVRYEMLTYNGAIAYENYKDLMINYLGKVQFNLIYKKI